MSSSFRRKSMFPSNDMLDEVSQKIGRGCVPTLPTQPEQFIDFQMIDDWRHIVAGRCRRPRREDAKTQCGKQPTFCLFFFFLNVRSKTFYWISQLHRKKSTIRKAYPMLKTSAKSIIYCTQSMIEMLDYNDTPKWQYIIRRILLFATIVFGRHS